MSKRSFVCAGLLSVGLLTSVCVGQNQIPSVVSPLDEGSGIELFQVGPGKKISRREAYQSNIRGLTGELSEARDEKKKAEITKQLESVVGNMFDMDMKGRDAELSKLEARSAAQEAARTARSPPPGARRDYPARSESSH